MCEPSLIILRLLHATTVIIIVGLAGVPSCSFCDLNEYESSYNYCGACGGIRYGTDAVIKNGSKCPSRVLDHKCTICGGDGKVDKVSYCTHGLRYSHSYCAHNKAGKHDK